MMKHSVNELTSFSFWRLCIGVALLHMALLAMLPVLPYQFSKQQGVPLNDFAPLYILFIIGVLAVGPFHAWLADAFKRKHVFQGAVLGLMLCFLGSPYLNSFAQVWGVSLLSGAFYGIAASAGITISVDIVTSEKRSAANRVLFASILLCMVFGVCLSRFGWLYDFRLYAYVVAGILLLSLLLAGSVYVAFRAPIGVKAFSLDRFFLPYTWLLSFNMLLAGMIPGLLMPLTGTSLFFSVCVAFLVLAPLARPVVGAFINMAHHCQRATANISLLFSLMSGLLLGACFSYVYACVECSESMALMALGASLLSLPFSRKHYKKHRVRG